MNTHESYVSLEVAKLLTQAGFDWKEYLKPLHIYDGGGRTWEIPLHIAQKWLREVKHIHIDMVHDFPSGTDSLAYFAEGYRVNQTDSFIQVKEHGKTYEEGLEACIKKCLEEDCITDKCSEE